MGRVAVTLERDDVYGWDGWWIRRGALELGLVPEVGGRLLGMRWRDDELAFVHPAHCGRREDVAGAPDPRARKRELGLVHFGGDKTWLAPQERWTDAIPFLDLDVGAYDVAVERADAGEVRIAMRSPVCRETGVRVARTIVVRDDDEEGFGVRHELENASPTDVAWALWDVQELRAPGIAYLPIRGDSSFPGGLKAFPAEGDSEGARADVVGRLGRLVTVECRRRRWFKFGADAGEGWIAGIVEPAPGRLVGHRKDVIAAPDASYAHGCVIEVYNDPRLPFFELEVHGPIVRLAPGERAVLDERRRLFDVAAWPDRDDVDAFLPRP
jgi:hypothetical protein